MTVSTAEDAQWDPGYVFLTPYQEEQAGPYIYDKRGVRGCRIFRTSKNKTDTLSRTSSGQVGQNQGLGTPTTFILAIGREIPISACFKAYNYLDIQEDMV